MTAKEDRAVHKAKLDNVLKTTLSGVLSGSMVNPYLDPATRAALVKTFRGRMSPDIAVLTMLLDAIDKLQNPTINEK